MDASVEGRLCVVAGGSSGIGFAVAKAFHAAGARVFLSARDPVKLSRAADSISPGTWRCAADVATAEGAGRLVEAVLAEGAPDFLINCVGRYEARSFEEAGDDAWEASFQTNLMSAVRVTRGLLPAMRAAGRGSVVFIASEAAVRSVGLLPDYSTMKAAVLGLSRTVAEGLRGTGLRANAYIPGPTATEAIRDYFAGIARSRGVTEEEAVADFFRRDQPGSLLGRLIDPTDHGRAILLLATTPAMNGAAMRADGGAIHSII